MSEGREVAEEEGEEVAEEKPEEVKEEFLEERIYTVPLRRAWIAPRKKRTPKAVRILRQFVRRHMKSEEITIMPEVNEALWSRGIEKPPRRIKIRATKDKDGKVTVYLAEGG